MPRPLSSAVSHKNKKYSNVKETIISSRKDWAKEKKVEMKGDSFVRENFFKLPRRKVTIQIFNDNFAKGDFKAILKANTGQPFEGLR